MQLCIEQDGQRHFVHTIGLSAGDAALTKVDRRCAATRATALRRTHDLHKGPYDIVLCDDAGEPLCRQPGVGAGAPPTMGSGT